MTIIYTQGSWNPIVGCKECSEGCLNCYAARDAATRLSHVPAYEGLAERAVAPLETSVPDWHRTRLSHVPAYEGLAERAVSPLETSVPDGHRTRFRWTGKVSFRQDVLVKPLHWTKPRRLFVCSTSDLFYEGVTDAERDAVWSVMLLCPQHTFLVCTKRPDAMAKYISAPEASLRIATEMVGQCSNFVAPDRFLCPPNIWLGTTVEDADNMGRLTKLLSIYKAYRRWVSFEPLLGGSEVANALPDDLQGLHWAVIGGESGPQARACYVGAIAKLLERLRKQKVPTYVKQIGARAWCADQFTCPPSYLPLSDRKGMNMADWPKYLRVREYPQEWGVDAGT